MIDLIAQHQALKLQLLSGTIFMRFILFLHEYCYCENAFENHQNLYLET